MTDEVERSLSLVDFPEYVPNVKIKSPRSLAACRAEGIMPDDLIYKPMETFADKALSPRLVKLRYDFFEAKRKDLLQAARKAREGILTEEKHEKEVSSKSLNALAQQTGVTMSQILALNSDSLKLERQKMLRAQEREQMWLRRALNNELRQVAIMDKNSQKLSAEEADNEAATREDARRRKELNDRRQQEEERKQREREAQNKLEKAIAKKQFHNQQEELQRQQEKERQKKLEIYQRQMAEMERKKEAEREKERKKQEAWERQCQRIEEMRAEDMRRNEIMLNSKQTMLNAMMDMKDKKDTRIAESIEKNQEIERQRRHQLEQRMMADQQREERLALEKAIQQEEGAKQSFQLMLRRKNIQEEAARKLENRRMDIRHQQDETERRLLEHEQKKERYLDFKRELDTLKTKNKEINVDRERRRQEFHRSRVAEEAAKKDERISVLKSERQRLWDLRRQAQAEAYYAREQVKEEVIKQRTKSAYNQPALKEQVSRALSNDLFSPKILQTSNSMPALKPKSPPMASTSEMALA